MNFWEYNREIYSHAIYIKYRSLRIEKLRFYIELLMMLLLQE